MPQENRRCADCRFAERVKTYDANASYDDQRQSRRAAPSNGADIGKWPRVLLNDWCHQFEPARSGGGQAASSSSGLSATNRDARQAVETLRVNEVAKQAVAASWSDVINELNRNHQSPPAGTLSKLPASAPRR